MHKSIFSTMVAAAILASGAAFAAETTGTIKSINEDTQMVTLNDGMEFTFGTDFKRHNKADGYLPGDKVSVVWEANGDKHVASSMSPNFSHGATGKIAKIDVETKTVMLEGDKTPYVFSGNRVSDIGLDGFKVGDSVKITTGGADNMHAGKSIASAKSMEVTGKVKSIDQATRTVTLEDGKVFMFEGSSKDIDLGGYKAGDSVKIEAVSVGHSHIGEAISPA